MTKVVTIYNEPFDESKHFDPTTQKIHEIIAGLKYAATHGALKGYNTDILSELALLSFLLRNLINEQEKINQNQATMYSLF